MDVNIALSVLIHLLRFIPSFDLGGAVDKSKIFASETPSPCNPGAVDKSKVCVSETPSPYNSGEDICSLFYLPFCILVLTWRHSTFTMRNIFEECNKVLSYVMLC